MYSLDLGRVETVAAVRKIMRPGAMFCPTPDGQQELRFSSDSLCDDGLEERMDTWWAPVP